MTSNLLLADAEEGDLYAALAHRGVAVLAVRLVAEMARALATSEDAVAAALPRIRDAVFESSAMDAITELAAGALAEGAAISAPQAGGECYVRDLDGGVYEFREITGRLVMIRVETGAEVAVESYGDAVWRMGEAADGSAPCGPRPFVDAWQEAVPATFGWMRAGSEWVAS